jgi:hypothetical protein
VKHSYTTLLRGYGKTLLFLKDLLALLVQLEQQDPKEILDQLVLQFCGALKANGKTESTTLLAL